MHGPHNGTRSSCTEFYDIRLGSHTSTRARGLVAAAAAWTPPMVGVGAAAAHRKAPIAYLAWRGISWVRPAHDRLQQRQHVFAAC